MDFEKYIGKEKQLLSRLERERASLDAYEMRGNAGSLDYAEDELKLLDMLKLFKDHISAAEAAAKALDDRSARLLEMEAGLNRKSAQAQKHIEEWESSFDSRYNELLKHVEEEVARLERRNNELLMVAKAQEDALNARSAEISSKAASVEAGLKQAGDEAYQELSEALLSIKKAQREFEASISGKLDEDRQTIDRIKYMLSTMSDIIKS